MKPVMDPKTVWFAYYKEDPIAMFISVPDVNQFTKHFNGKLGILEKLRFLWMKKRVNAGNLSAWCSAWFPNTRRAGVDSFMIQGGRNGNPKFTSMKTMKWAGPATEIPK